MLQKGALCGMFILGLITIFSLSTYAEAYGERAFSPRSLTVQIFSDGIARIEYTLDVDVTYASIRIPLFGDEFQNIIVLNHLGEALDYEPIEGGINIDTLGTYRVQVIYETGDLISNVGGVWTFRMDAPVNVKVILPEDADVISLNRLPISIETVDDKKMLLMLPGELEVIYAIIVSTPTLTPVPEIPGVPSDVSAYNHSTLIPKDFSLTIPSRKPTVLIFRNFLLIVNSTERLDLSLTVDSEVTEKYLLMNLELGESLRLDVEVDVSPPTGIVTLDNDVGIYVDVETNIIVPIKAVLGLYLNEAALEEELGRDVDISRLTWMYWNGSEWISVSSHIDANGYLITTTTHLSVWSVVEKVPLQITAQLSPEAVTPGEEVTVSVTAKDTYGKPIEGATVEATIGDEVITLSELGDGNYEGSIETKDLKVGDYSVTITAKKAGYESAQTSKSFTVKEAPVAIPWMLYVGVAAVIVIIIVLAVLFLAKRTS